MSLTAEELLLEAQTALGERGRILMSRREALQLCQTVIDIEALGIAGDLAEVGVCMDGTAYLICAARRRERQVMLFDTWAGLPEDVPGFYAAKDLACPLAQVTTLLDRFGDVLYCRGLFPETVRNVRGAFAFVHLDTDLYDSTLDGLQFFYPMLVPGGTVLIHNYGDMPGVRLACEQFSHAYDVPLVPMQGLHVAVRR